MHTITINNFIFYLGKAAKLCKRHFAKCCFVKSRLIAIHTLWDKNAPMLFLPRFHDTSRSINVPDSVESCLKNFTEQISRSGLSHPSWSCFKIMQKLWELVEILQSDDEIFSRFVRIFYFDILHANHKSIYHFIKTN